MRISDWSSDVCSSDLLRAKQLVELGARRPASAPGFPRCGVREGNRSLQTLRTPDPVRIERSRDAPKDSAIPMGVSTMLDTNGKRGRDRICDRHHSVHPGYCAIPRSDWLSLRSEEHTSELQSLMRISYAVFC